MADFTGTTKGDEIFLSSLSAPNDWKPLVHVQSNAAYNPKEMLMSVVVDTSAGFSSGTPTPLFQVRGRAPISSTDLFTYDVTRDGQKFLVNQYVKPDRIEPLTILQHALAEPVK